MYLQRLLAGLLGMLLAVATLAQAPDILLHDLEGRPRNVNEFVGHGQWTVVAVWAHDCHICEKEIHEMAAFHHAHQANDAIVLGVSLDGVARMKEARDFVRRNRLPFVNLISEPRHETMLKFGAGRFIGTPTFYIYTPQGEIVGQNIGPVTAREIEDFMAAPESIDSAGQ